MRAFAAYGPIAFDEWLELSVSDVTALMDALEK